MARHAGHAGLFREFFRGNLIAHGHNGVGVRTDESDFLFLEAFGKIRIFRQKSIAGMHRIRARIFHGLNDFIHHKIGLVHRRRTQMHRLIRHLDMERIFIGIGINRDSLYAHLPRGLNHTASNFPAIGDEDFFDFSH